MQVRPEGAAGPRREGEQPSDRHLKHGERVGPELPPLRLQKDPARNPAVPAEHRDGHSSRDQGARMQGCQDYENSGDVGQPEQGGQDYENNRDLDYDDFVETTKDGKTEGQLISGGHNYENSGQSGMNTDLNNYEPLAGRRDPANIYCKVNNDTDYDDFTESSAWSFFLVFDVTGRTGVTIDLCYFIKAAGVKVVWQHRWTILGLVSNRVLNFLLSAIEFSYSQHMSAWCSFQNVKRM